jgi:hypothetical protein
VKVERRFTHPVMKKTVRRSKNYHAHDEANAAKMLWVRLLSRRAGRFGRRSLVLDQLPGLGLGIGTGPIRPSS